MAFMAALNSPRMEQQAQPAEENSGNVKHVCSEVAPVLTAGQPNGGNSESCICLGLVEEKAVDVDFGKVVDENCDAKVASLPLHVL